MLHSPPFPDTPGKWLASYRYRWQATGRPLSPEQLGVLLGVSGTTVRRWEAGRLRPTREDLAHFSEVCDLSPLEREFLLAAFHGREEEEPPDSERFESLVSRSLNSALPAFVLDSLFYIRGWNTYTAQLIGWEEEGVPERNALEGLFRDLGPRRQSVASPERDERWLRSFWLSTASLTGTEAYRELLQRLRGLGNFEDRWRNLALEHNPGSPPINLPFLFRHRLHGTFRIFITTVTLPPVYYVREFVPVDQTARSFINELQESGPARAISLEKYHWALTGREALRS